MLFCSRNWVPVKSDQKLEFMGPSGRRVLETSERKAKVEINFAS